MEKEENLNQENTTAETSIEKMKIIRQSSDKKKKLKLQKKK